MRDAAERERIRQALDQTDWNVSGAARLLGTERTSLHKRIRALGLKRSSAGIADLRRRASAALWRSCAAFRGRRCSG